MILGVDEVGRGPWAGPLVVGAVVLGDTAIDGLTDSKKLTKRRRQELDVLIREHAAGFGLGWVHAAEIDTIGLSAALVEATKQAVRQINVAYHEIIIDGTINFLADTGKGRYVTTLKKADLLIPSVSAASIIAKVARDSYMCEQDDVYPGYGFKSHVGYGTAKHREVIAKKGVTPLHRLSFMPLTKYMEPTKITQQTTTKMIGDAGESAAAEYLARQGHVIVARNWKTKFCEIDIVSLRDNVVYCTEVKYRKTAAQGGGLAAITPQKLRKMKFAAELYTHTNKVAGDFRLAVMSVTGQPPQVETYLEIE